MTVAISKEIGYELIGQGLISGKGTGNFSPLHNLQNGLDSMGTESSPPSQVYLPREFLTTHLSSSARVNLVICIHSCKAQYITEGHSERAGLLWPTP